MKASQISGFAAGLFAVIAVVAVDEESFIADTVCKVSGCSDNICTAAICFFIAALCLFFIYRDHEMLTACEDYDEHA